MHAAGNEPEAKIDYWYRHTSTVLAVTTVRHRPELSLVCQDGRLESMPSAAAVHTAAQTVQTSAAGPRGRIGARVRFAFAVGIQI